MYEKIYYVKTPPKRKSRFIYFIKHAFLLFIFLFTVNVFANIFLYPSVAKGSVLVSPLANDIIQKSVSFINSMENSKNLENIVLGQLKDESGNYGVVIKNLNTGERYYLNEKKVFTSASLYKLWVMAVVFEQIENNTFKDSDVLMGNVKEFNLKLNVATDSSEMSDEIISWSVKSALENMITISDNYSALLLTKFVKIENVKKFLEENNFRDSKIGTQTDNPKTSARDTLNYFEKLNNHELKHITLEESMLDLLKRQRLNGKLPKYLPEGTVFAHKTGELGPVSHDAGIVYGPKSKYVIAILSSTKNTVLANENMAKISRTVYDYFLK